MAAALAALFLVALAVVPVFVPQRAVRGFVLRTLDRACGCRVVVRGRFALTLWPEPGMTATRLWIEDPPGFAPRPLLRVHRIVLGASWGALFEGRWALASVRIRKARLVLRRNARGASNLSVFLHAGPPSSPSSSPAAPAASQGPPSSVPAPLGVFGRLVVHGFTIVEEPGARLLADVRRLELGPSNHGGLPVTLNARLPQGKKALAAVVVRGRIVMHGIEAGALHLATLDLRDPLAFPGPLTAGTGRIGYRLEGDRTRLTVSSLVLTDPRLGRASVAGGAVFVKAKVAHASGSIRLRLLPSAVVRYVPWLRPRPGHAGLLVTTHGSAQAGRLGPAPFALSWAGGRTRAHLSGTVAGTRHAGRWCWTIQAQGEGIGLRFPNSSTAPVGRPSSAAAPVASVRDPASDSPAPPGPCLGLRARLARVDLEAVPVSRLRFAASVTGTHLVVSDLRAALLGGVLQGQLQGRLVGPRPEDLTARLSYARVELARVLRIVDPGAGVPLSGRIGGAARLTTHTGISFDAWKGAGTVTGSNLVWRGIDLPALVRTLGTVIHGRLPLRWPSGGVTPIGHLQAFWTLALKRLTLPHLALESSVLRVDGMGNIALSGPGRLDLLLELAPGSKIGTRGWPRALRGIEVPVHVGGSLAHPRPVPDVPVVLKRLLRRRVGGILGGIFRRG